jgi:hypothetical protein
VEKTANRRHGKAMKVEMKAFPNFSKNALNPFNVLPFSTQSLTTIRKNSVGPCIVMYSEMGFFPKIALFLLAVVTL